MKRNDIKQVIVIRKDLKMGKGKIASQACHASMSVFFNCLIKTKTIPQEILEDKSLMTYNSYWSMPNLVFFEEYITGSFKKIVVGVNSKEELLKLYEEAYESGIYCSIIQDSGLTSFNNVPTYTAIAIGPWLSEEIDQITGHLSLL